MKKFLTVACLFLCIGIVFSETLPTVLWHGMGDSANSFGMKRIQDAIKEETKQFVYSIRIGESETADQVAGFFYKVSEKLEYVCRKLKTIPQLKNGFNAIGISQGSQFLRAYTQKCNDPPVNVLISIGGQHQGVYGFPKCPGARRLLNTGAYLSIVQNRLVQAQYWHDPNQRERYLSNNIFLPELNNEIEGRRNENYKKNLMKLKKFVMVRFTKDTMVEPPISQQFGFYKDGQSQEVEPLRDTRLYKEDWLGLRKMDKEGKLVFIDIEDDHLRFSLKWLIDEIIKKYFIQSAENTSS